MIIFAFIMSAAVTGLLLALFARTQGVEHTGILVAIGIIGAGIQMLALLTWYLHHTSESAQQRRARKLIELEEPSADRIDGR